MKSKVALTDFYLLLAAILCVSQGATEKQQELATHLQKAQGYLHS